MDSTNKTFRKQLGALFLCAAFFAANCAAAFSLGDDFFKTDEIDESIQRELVIFHSMANLNLNPHTSAYVSEAQILNGVYEGLFSYNAATLEPDNALAQDFRISRDKLRWTFTIREGAKTSSGQEITAQTIKDSWLNLIANKGAYYSSLLDVIKGAREYRLSNGKREDVAIYASGRKLSVELTRPTSHLNKILCSLLTSYHLNLFW